LPFILVSLFSLSMAITRPAGPTTYPLCLTAPEEPEKNALVVARLCENVDGDTGKWEEDLQNGEVLYNKTDLSHLNDLKFQIEFNLGFII